MAGLTFCSWEAVYFNLEVPVLQGLATSAVGAERFVVDDGWFPARAHDRAGLGDWSIDAAKFPDGFKPLIDHVPSLGMDFGLWVEPEMVNVDSGPLPRPSRPGAACRWPDAA